MLYGDEDYLKKYYAREIKDAYISPEFANLNYNFYDHDNFDQEKIIDCAMSLPFMSEFRVIETKNLLAYKNFDSSSFLAVVDKFPRSTLIIFREDKIDKRTKIYKKLSEVGDALEIKYQSPKNLITWVIKLCEREKIFLTNDHAEYLIKNLVPDMNLIKQEINKLIAFVHDKKIITRDDIDLITCKTISTRVFELVKHMANKNLDRSLDIFDDLITLKEQPLVILALIARQIMLMLQTNFFSHEGLSLSEISAVMKTQNFVIREALDQSKNFSHATLISMTNQCLESDFKIKTGQLNDKIALKNLIIKACTNKIQ